MRREPMKENHTIEIQRQKYQPVTTNKATTFDQWEERFFGTMENRKCECQKKEPQSLLTNLFVSRYYSLETY